MPPALRVGGNVNWGRFMKSANQLTARERDFFNLVFQAGITNPFSDERAEIDLKIGGLFPEVSQPDRIEKTINEVQRRIRSLEKNRIADLSLFTGDDRRFVRAAFLFEFFNPAADRIFRQGEIFSDFFIGGPPVPQAFDDFYAAGVDFHHYSCAKSSKGGSAQEDPFGDDPRRGNW